MEKIIEYSELPPSRGQSIYLRMEETDPALYFRLFNRGYKIVNRISDADKSTIYVTGRRQDTECLSQEEYRLKLDKKICGFLEKKNLEKPSTIKFTYQDLINYKYRLPFVLKNERQNGGREKFLISTEEDYKNLIRTCDYLYNKMYEYSLCFPTEDKREQIDYPRYLEECFTVQEFIDTPTKYCTTVRVLTSSSNDVLCSLLKYKEPVELNDNTTFFGDLLSSRYKLSTKSIVSNTLSGGSNILIGEDIYSPEERRILDKHNIPSEQFEKVLSASKDIHSVCKSELGIICGFDYIYSQDTNRWYLLEYHSRPMVGEYARRNGIKFENGTDSKVAEGRVRATALSLTLKKQR